MLFSSLCSNQDTHIKDYLLNRLLFYFVKKFHMFSTFALFLKSSQNKKEKEKHIQYYLNPETNLHSPS